MAKAVERAEKSRHGFFITPPIGRSHDLSSPMGGCDGVSTHAERHGWPAIAVSFQQLQSRPETMKGRPNGEPYTICIRCIQIVYVVG